MPADHNHRNDPVEPNSDNCEECGQDHNLRVCTTCGHVGCCDSSEGHARDHYEDTGHPVIRSIPQDSGFVWCYICDKYLD